MTDESVTIEGESESEIKKPFKEVPVVLDQGVFQHSTGDAYDGFFEAKKKDKIAKMHGPGKYTTAEGDTYVGTWENDRLGANEEVTISFNDGSRYEGLFKDWSYNGHGRYYYPDGSILEGEFSDNAPTGQLVLFDPNGHRWLGRAELGYGWFSPVNHYYDMLETARESKIKKKNGIKDLVSASTKSPV